MQSTTSNAIPVGAPQRVLLSLDEVAVSTGLSRAFLYRLIGAGKLTSIKAGRRRLIPVSALESYIQALVQEESA